MDSKPDLPERSAAHRLATVFGILLLIFCFVYFFELASFPFSLDEEWAALRKDPSVWIGQGRWGSFLIEKYILPQPSIPFVPQMMFAFGSAASFLLILRTMRRDILALSVADYASFVFFCAFPAWFFIVEFSSNIGSVGLGMASGTYGAYLAMTARSTLPSRNAILFLLFACLLGAFAIATYQTLLFYLFCACAGSLVARSLENDTTVERNDLLQIAAFIFGSVVLYAAISWLFKYFYSAKETYTNAFFHLDYFLSDPFLALLKTVKEGAAFYGLVDNVFGSPVWALPIVLATGLLALTLDGDHGMRRRLVLLAGAGAILAAPFALNPFFPGLVLGRTMVAVPIAAWLFCYFGVNSRLYWIRIAASVALAVAIAQIVVLQNRSQASSYFLAKHDLLVATSIYDRFGNSPGFRKGTRYPLAVFGGRTYRTVFPIPATSNAAASFMGPFVGNTQRVLSYIRILGLEGIRPATEAELDAVVVRLSKMPIWPAAGSVVLENGVLLVRLGRDPSPSDAAALARLGVKTQ